MITQRMRTGWRRFKTNLDARKGVSCGAGATQASRDRPAVFPRYALCGLAWRQGLAAQPVRMRAAEAWKFWVDLA